MDLLKDYDISILHHPSKDNMVTDALSRKAASTPIRDLCLRISIISQLLDLIREKMFSCCKFNYIDFFLRLHIFSMGLQSVSLRGKVDM